MLNRLYMALALVALLAGSYWYTYDKGGDNRESKIVAAQKQEADKELVKRLGKANADLLEALSKQQQSQQRANELSDALYTNQQKTQSLQKDLQDAKKETDPACNKLPPSRYKLYQSIYNKAPSLN
jgi:chromosome segregation ATPase